MQQLEQSIARYLNNLDRADREPSLVPPERVSHLKQKIATVKEQVRKLRRIEKQLQEAPDQQVSLTDPDARSMATSGRGTGVVGYNVQAVVDTEQHMIVAHEVTNIGHDRSQLGAMSTLAREAIGAGKLTVLADRWLLRWRGDLALRRCGNHATGSQAVDLEQQGRRALRQA